MASNLEHIGFVLHRQGDRDQFAPLLEENAGPFNLVAFPLLLDGLRVVSPTPAVLKAAEVYGHRVLTFGRDPWDAGPRARQAIWEQVVAKVRPGDATVLVIGDEPWTGDKTFERTAAVGGLRAMLKECRKALEGWKLAVNVNRRGIIRAWEALIV